MKNGVYSSKQGFYYVLDGRKSLAVSRDREKIAMEYINKFVEKHPKYKPLLEGKTWKQIFQIMGVSDHAR